LYELGVIATRVLVHPAGGDAADGRRA